MKFRRAKTFHSCFDDLPPEIQIATKDAFRLFEQHPHYPYHPSLRVKRMKGFEDIWEGHITLGYVFTFCHAKDSETGELIVVFRKIGKHDEVYSNP